MSTMLESSGSINILLVDDQALLRQSLANLLEQHADLKIVGVASDGREAIKQIAIYRPDVVLLDIEMPNLDGLGATRLITQRFPETKVIVLSAHDNEVYLRNAIQSGAKAYLLKNTLFEELSDTVRLVYRGYSQFSNGIIEKVIAGFDNQKASLDTQDNGPYPKDILLLVNENQESLKLEEVLPFAKLTLEFLDRFEPGESQRLVELLLAFPEIADALQTDICQRLAAAPKNLALLYLHGTLAHQSWSQPEAAFRSLEIGFQTGLEQAISPEALLLFYRQAALLQPHLAFRWLTQVAGPWDDYHHLPFLTQEAIKLFGENSFQARSIILLNRIEKLKHLLLEQIHVSPKRLPIHT